MTPQTYDQKILDDIMKRYRIAGDAYYSVSDRPLLGFIPFFGEKEVLLGYDLCKKLADLENDPNLTLTNSRIKGGKIELEFLVKPEWSEEQKNDWVSTMINYGASKIIPDVHKKIKIVQLPPTTYQWNPIRYFLS